MTKYPEDSAEAVLLDKIHKRFGQRATLRFRSAASPTGQSQWWVIDGTGSLRCAAPTLAGLIEKLDVATPPPAPASADQHPEVPVNTKQKLLTINDAAAILGCTAAGIRGFISQRGLKATTVPGRGGKHYRIGLADLEAWRAKNTWKHYGPMSTKKKSSTPLSRPAPSLGTKYTVSFNGAIAARLSALHAVGVDTSELVEKAVAAALARVSVKVTY